MAVISGIHDTLDRQVERFDQKPLATPVVLNSIPKGGTHLLRNILRMFVPVDQHYDRDFLQSPNMHLHLAALNPNAPRLSSAHLLFDDQAAANLAKVKHLLLVRDPHTWVLARARFLVSDAFDQPNLSHLKSGLFPVDTLISMMIFGIHQKLPALSDIYTHNALAWIASRQVHLVRYEDLSAAAEALDSDQADKYFSELLDACQIERPRDWKERVRVGADRRSSRTSRENLSLPPGLAFPDTLSDAHQKLIDIHAPGLRAFLGYTDQG